jgi:exonuclease VII small subunit
MKLAKICSNKLEEAEKKVTLLIEESGGSYTRVPFELEEKQDDK